MGRIDDFYFNEVTVVVQILESGLTLTYNCCTSKVQIGDIVIVPLKRGEALGRIVDRGPHLKKYDYMKDVKSVYRVEEVHSAPGLFFDIYHNDSNQLCRFFFFGNYDLLTIPSTINGKKVPHIEIEQMGPEKCFIDKLAFDEGIESIDSVEIHDAKIKTIELPKTLKRISKGLLTSSVKTIIVKSNLNIEGIAQGWTDIEKIKFQYSQDVTKQLYCDGKLKSGMTHVLLFDAKSHRCFIPNGIQSIDYLRRADSTVEEIHFPKGFLTLLHTKEGHSLNSVIMFFPKSTCFLPFFGQGSLGQLHVDSLNPNFTTHNGIVCSSNGAAIWIPENPASIGEECLNEIIPIDRLRSETVILHQGTKIISLNDVWGPDISCKRIGIEEGIERIDFNLKCESDVFLPSSINSIKPGAFSETLGKVLIDENNPHFTADEQFVYSKDRSTIVSSIGKNKTNCVQISNSVISIQEKALGYHFGPIVPGSSFKNASNLEFEIDTDRYVFNDYIDEYTLRLKGGSSKLFFTAPRRPGGGKDQCLYLGEWRYNSDNRPVTIKAQTVLYKDGEEIEDVVSNEDEFESLLFFDELSDMLRVETFSGFLSALGEYSEHNVSVSTFQELEDLFGEKQRHDFVQSRNGVEAYFATHANALLTYREIIKVYDPHNTIHGCGQEAYLRVIETSTIDLELLRLINGVPTSQFCYLHNGKTYQVILDIRNTYSGRLSNNDSERGDLLQNIERLNLSKDGVLNSDKGIVGEFDDYEQETLTRFDLSNATLFSKRYSGTSDIESAFSRRIYHYYSSNSYYVLHDLFNSIYLSEQSEFDVESIFENYLLLCSKNDRVPEYSKQSIGPVIEKLSVHPSVPCLWYEGDDCGVIFSFTIAQDTDFYVLLSAIKHHFKAKHWGVVTELLKSAVIWETNDGETILTLVLNCGLWEAQVLSGYMVEDIDENVWYSTWRYLSEDDFDLQQTSLTISLLKDYSRNKTKKKFTEKYEYENGIFRVEKSHFEPSYYASFNPRHSGEEMIIPEFGFQFDSKQAVKITKLKGTINFRRVVVLKNISEIDWGFFGPMVKEIDLSSASIQKVFDLPRSVEKLLLPDTIKSIPSYRLSSLNIRDLTLPDSIEELGEYCLSSCANLRSIKLPERLKELKRRSFSGCSSLSNIDFGSALVKIGAYCFERCDSLGVIFLPEGLEEIGPFAFSGLKNPATIYVPETVKHIHEGAFFNDSCGCIVYFNGTLKQYLGISKGPGNVPRGENNSNKLFVKNDVGEYVLANPTYTKNRFGDPNFTQDQEPAIMFAPDVFEAWQNHYGKATLDQIKNTSIAEAASRATFEFTSQTRLKIAKRIAKGNFEEMTIANEGFDCKYYENCSGDSRTRKIHIVLEDQCLTGDCSCSYCLNNSSGEDFPCIHVLGAVIFLGAMINGPEETRQRHPSQPPKISSVTAKLDNAIREMKEKTQGRFDIVTTLKTSSEPCTIHCNVCGKNFKRGSITRFANEGYRCPNCSDLWDEHVETNIQSFAKRSPETPDSSAVGSPQFEILGSESDGKHKYLNLRCLSCGELFKRRSDKAKTKASCPGCGNESPVVPDENRPKKTYTPEFIQTITEGCVEVVKSFNDQKAEWAFHCKLCDQTWQKSLQTAKNRHFRCPYCEMESWVISHFENGKEK